MKDFRSLIRQHEDEKNELIAAIKKTVKCRDASPDAWDEWKRAASRFHQHYRESEVDRLLRRCRAEGIQQDTELRDFTFSYIATDPYFFRSGYILERLVRLIKKLDLSEVEKVLIQELILRRIDEKALRNFRDICRLIPKIETEGFSNKIAIRLRSEEPSIRHRAALAASYFGTHGKMKGEGFVML